jgi:diadenosine tetraphosphatase ApaH/serine/threonine PP2A family protein phosphatase
VTYPLTAIISDLHSNTPALDTALADCRDRGVQRYVCLGDVIGYGADPCGALDRVMDLCVPARENGLCLQGNHEYALCYNAEDFNPKARAAIDWTHVTISGAPERSSEYWDFLGDLQPVDTDEVAMFAHGSPRDPVREYILPRDARDETKMQANFEVMQRPVCFVGHSHVPAVYYKDGTLFRPDGTDGPFALGDLDSNPCIVNVGSIGQPRDGDARLSYVIFDGANITFVRLEYDWRAAAEAIRSVPELPEFLADRLKDGR